MKIVRTSEERLGNLPVYPFAANRRESAHARIHYLDEGEEIAKAAIDFIKCTPAASGKSLAGDAGEQPDR